MLRRFSISAPFRTFVLCASLITAIWPVAVDANRRPAQAGEQKPTTGSIQGRAQPNQTVRLRDAKTNEVVATTTADSTGLFTFEKVPPASYTTEMLNPDGSVAATSQQVIVLPGSTVTALTAAQAANATGSTISQGSLWWENGIGSPEETKSLSNVPAATTALVVSSAAAAVGVTALVVSRADASPSR